MIRLYMDESVHGAITDGLRRRGIDLVTVQEDGREGVADPDVLNRAGELTRVLFTQDDDFLAEAVQRLRSGEEFTVIIYARQQVSVGQCITDFEYLSNVGDLEDFNGQIIYLPLS